MNPLKLIGSFKPNSKKIKFTDGSLVQLIKEGKVDILYDFDIESKKIEKEV
jgi:predicted DNA-binding antitoxin AbrB/MazE fold protein